MSGCNTLLLTSIVVGAAFPGHAIPVWCAVISAVQKALYAGRAVCVRLMM